MNTVTVDENMKELYESGDIFKSGNGTYFILSRIKDLCNQCNLVDLSNGFIFNTQTELWLNDQNFIHNYLHEYMFTKVPKGTKITISCNE